MTRFYEMRGDCRCPALEEHWEQIRNVDDAQAAAQEYAEAYVANQAQYDSDSIFMNALRSRIAAFGKAIEASNEVFVRKCHDGAIAFESHGKRLTIEQAAYADERPIMKCATCGTEIPHLKYPGWNESSEQGNQKISGG